MPLHFSKFGCAVKAARTMKTFARFGLRNLKLRLVRFATQSLYACHSDHVNVPDRNRPGKKLSGVGGLLAGVVRCPALYAVAARRYQTATAATGPHSAQDAISKTARGLVGVPSGGTFAGGGAGRFQSLPASP